MTPKQKFDITAMSKEFAKQFYDITGGIAGSGCIIVNPLANYLDFCGYKNTLEQIPASDKTPQILIINFEDGSCFIPAGSDFKNISPKAIDWLWID